MKPIGKGTRSSGVYTGLGIAQQFANAAVHFLRDHNLAKRRQKGGVELPINESTWKEVLSLEFHGKGQLLKKYCGYFNSGAHGHGHDLNGHVDFGIGKRSGDQRKGRPVDPSDRVYPGTTSKLTPQKVLQIIVARLDEIPKSEGNALNFALQQQWQHAEAANKFDPSDDEEARDRILAAIVQRYGQAEFRSKLISAYGGHCCITTCDATDALEAAHIKPYNGPKTNHLANGLLLRADIHTLFDLNLIGINPTSREVVLDQSLMSTSYEKYNRRKLRSPMNGEAKPSAAALKHRWAKFQQLTL